MIKRLRFMGLAVLAAALVLPAGSAALAEGPGGPVKLAATLYGEGEVGDYAYPAAVACGQKLVVADTGNKRLLFYDIQGKQFHYAGKFDAGGKLGYPFCVAELPGGRLLVGERGKPTPTLCDPKADTAVPAQLSGVPQSALLLPGRFCLGPEGRLYLIDNGTRRILVLSADFKFEREVSVRGENFTGFNDVRVDRHGNIFALETLRGLIHVFDPNGKPLRSFGAREGSGAPFQFPVSLALDYHGNVYVLDSHRAQLLVFDSEGRLQWRMGGFGWKEGSFNDPAYVSVDAANRIFLADRLNNRIEVYVPLRAM